jgi:hypothetical protein
MEWPVVLPRTKRAFGTLAQALSHATGIEWTADPRSPDGLNIGTDWVLRSVTATLPVQVTRVAPQQRWQTVGATGAVDGAALASDAAAEMWEAIERKLPQQDGHTLLALDIRHPGFHGFPAARNVLAINETCILEEEPICNGYKSYW